MNTPGFTDTINYTINPTIEKKSEEIIYKVTNKTIENGSIGKLGTNGTCKSKTSIK